MNETRKGPPLKTRSVVVVCFALLGLSSASADPLGTAFTYQGRLNDGPNPANGHYDLQFKLYDAVTAGTVLGGSRTNNAVPVSNGLFTVTLDFGTGVFNGDARWLDIAVKTNGAAAFTPLVPRQPLTPAPYALYAPSAGTAAGSSAPGMVLIPAGSFTMGNSVAADTDITDANPTNVYVSAFYMDVNLVSLSQWRAVNYWAADHGYSFPAGLGKAANHPVQTVDWYDCLKWCNARSEQAVKTPVYYTDAGLKAVYKSGEVPVFVDWAAQGYRLPTEAEWEKAARGGLSGQRFPWANFIGENLANYVGNTASYPYDLGPTGYNAAFTNGVTPYTSPVGSFAANGYGLYDMAGNVFEWCWDWYGTPYAGGNDPHGPVGPGPVSFRVLRGGSWNNNAVDLRCASRYDYTPTYAGYSIGFRCVRGL